MDYTGSDMGIKGLEMIRINFRNKKSRRKGMNIIWKESGVFFRGNGVKEG